MSVQINLLPVAERRPKWPLKKLLLVTTLAIGFVLSGFYSFALYTSWSLEQQLSDARNRQELLRPTAVKMAVANTTEQQITVKNNLLVNLTKERKSWYAVLSHFGTITPAPIWFTEFTAIDKNSLRIKGMSSTYQDMAQFMERLSKDEIVGEPVLISAEKDGTLTATRFEMTVKFKGL